MTSPGEPDLRSVSRPKQARSQQTLVRLLDAAETLIEEKGLRDASIPEIVRRAGSSVGGFYARFRDKRELLRAIEERFFQELRGRVDELSDPERWRGAPATAIVRAAVDELVGTARARRALIAAFVSRAVQDPEFAEDALRFRREVSRRMIALLQTRRSEAGHPEPEVAADLAVQLAFAFMNQIVVFGEVRAGGRRLGDRELAEELTRNIVAYLGIREPEAPRSSRERSEP